MGISVADNFDHKSKKPLDARTSYSTLALMKAVTDANMNEGCLAYCAETDKYYKFLSTNTVDADTGKWREYKSGETYTAGDGIQIDDTNDNEISLVPSESTDMDEIVDDLPPITPIDLGEIVDPVPKLTYSGDVEMREEKNILFVDGVATMALANLNVYVNSSTGEDDYEGGYGFSSAKPFKTIGYAMNYLPKHSNKLYADYVRLYITGTFTATQFTSITFIAYTTPIEIYISNGTVFNNYGFTFTDCAYAFIRVDTACTFNVTDTTLVSRTAWGMIFNSTGSTLAIQKWNNAATITVVGNATSQARIRALTCSIGKISADVTINASYVVVLAQAEQNSNVFLSTAQGSNLTALFNVYHGSTLAYNSKTATGTISTGQGGRVYTGSQS